MTDIQTLHNMNDTPSFNPLPAHKDDLASSAAGPVIAALHAFGQALVDCGMLDGIHLDDEEPENPVLLFLIAPPDFGLAIEASPVDGKDNPFNVVVERTSTGRGSAEVTIRADRLREDLPALCRLLLEEIQEITDAAQAEETGV